MSLHIYTSYFAKMASREKDDDNDIYIQVSRSAGCSKISPSGKKLTDEIDEDFGYFLGNYSDTLEDYYNNLDKEDMDWFYGYLCDVKKFLDEDIADNNGEDIEMNVFLLCHENLEKLCTAEDVKSGAYKKGEYKRCHRRVIAKYMKDNYGLYIPEYDIKKENEEIVYRNYF